MNSETSFPPTDEVANRLVVLRGDITTSDADVIVNAASHSLLGMAGVSGAIFRAAGPQLRHECASLVACPEGQARITGAYELPARQIIHTVAPVWRGGTECEEQTLAQCYRKCFELIEKHQHRTAAFPSIGTGAHGFPLDRASRIASREMVAFLRRNHTVERIVVVCFDDNTFDAYSTAIEEMRVANQKDTT